MFGGSAFDLRRRIWAVWRPLLGQHRRSAREKPVEVLLMAPEDACAGDMLVLIRWHDRNVAVPLSQLAAINTIEAIGDWHYWLAQGYCF